MGERGIVRHWSWAQYARTTRRVSFCRLITRLASFDMGGKSRSTALIPSEMPVNDRHVPTYSPSEETKPSSIDRKQSQTCYSIYSFGSKRFWHKFSIVSLYLHERSMVKSWQIRAWFTLYSIWLCCALHEGCWAVPGSGEGHSIWEERRRIQ